MAHLKSRILGNGRHGILWDFEIQMDHQQKKEKNKTRTLRKLSTWTFPENQKSVEW